MFFYTPKETFMDFETTSVNMPEVADPTEESVKEQEVADPAEEGTADEQYDGTEDTEDNDYEEDDSDYEEEDADEQDDATNAAFAEMRRKTEELERQNRELQEKLANGERETEKQTELANAVAFARENGYSDEEIDDIISEIQAEQAREDELNAIKEENERLKAEKESLEEQRQYAEFEKLAQSDLRTLQKIDPNLSDLDDLGPEFAMLRSMGVEPERAYHMIKSADEKTKPKGAYAPGKLNKAKQEAEFYTSEELDSMTKEEIKKNWEKVQRSMARL